MIMSNVSVLGVFLDDMDPSNTTCIFSPQVVVQIVWYPATALWLLHIGFSYGFVQLYWLAAELAEYLLFSGC